MAIISTAFSRLFPKGRIWNFTGNLLLFKQAVDLSLERIRVFLKAAILESIPGKATQTQKEWFELLNLPYDASTTLKEKKDRSSAVYTAAGGQSLDYLNDQIQKEFPNIWLTEIDLYNYQVNGTVTTVSAYYRLVGLIDRICPLHLSPFYDIVIIEALDTAYCGICITGKAITGKVLEV
jgi:uncharacterized protein YmfQ (DUF2313 family)